MHPTFVPLSASAGKTTWKLFIIVLSEVTYKSITAPSEKKIVDNQIMGWRHYWSCLFICSIWRPVLWELYNLAVELRTIPMGDLQLSTPLLRHEERALETIRKFIGGLGNFWGAGIFFRYQIPGMNFFLGRSMKIFRVNWRAWIFFHLIFPCANIFLYFTCHHPL